MTCSETSTALGAYVLGALEPEERRRFEEHLQHCAVCIAELAEFASLPDLLDEVRTEDLQPVAVTPSPELYERVSRAAQIGQPHRAHPRRWLLAAAAAVILLGAATGVVIWATGQGSGTVAPPTAASASASASAGPVSATIVASERGGGSVLEVSVEGLRPGETCRLVAVDADGVRHPAGEWPVSAEGDGEWRGWADVERAALDEVVLLGDGGRELVRVTF